MAHTAVYLFLVVIIIVIVGSSGQDSRCPAHSTYSECPLRKSCRPTCENRNGTPACTKECDVAHPCVCNPGYVLNRKGKCVSKC